jgi:alanine-synthesizing transaminase
LVVSLPLYSKRLPWSASSNKLSELIAANHAANRPVLDLTISNPTRVLADYPHAEIAAAYAAIADFTYHPDPAGHPCAKQAIVSYYADQGRAVPEDRILLTASTSEAYSLLFKLLCDPSDEILIPLPSYPLFEYLAALESVQTIPYRLLYDGSWFIDFDDLRNRISSRTRAIVVVHPGNPTGAYLKPGEAARLLALAAEHNLPIISDEVFLDYPISAASTVQPSLCEHDGTLTFCLNGLSKLAGMPQMKLGWIVIGGPSDDRAAARRRLELLLDTYLSVSTPVQLVAPRLFQIGAGIQQQLQHRVRSNLAVARQILSGSAANPLHTEGGWSAIVRLPSLLSEEAWVLTMLQEESVIVQPGYFFDMYSEPHIVLSLITPPDVFTQGLSAIRRLLCVH